MSWTRVTVALLAAVVVGLIPTARAQSGPEGVSAAWDPAMLQVTQFEGSITRVTVDLVVENRISDPNLSVRGLRSAEVEPFALARPLDPGSYRLAFWFTVPADPLLRRSAGTVLLRDGKRVVAIPLRISHEVTVPTDGEVAVGFVTPSLDRIVTDSAGDSHVDEELAVLLENGFGDSTVLELAETIGAAVVGSRPGGLPVYQLLVSGADASALDAAAAGLLADGRVAAATRNWVSEPLIACPSPPDDPEYGECFDEADRDGENWGSEYIRLPSVWRAPVGVTGSATVPIAVVDTTFDSNHPDLDGNYNSGFSQFNDPGFVWVCNPRDCHGTEVAGVVAAEGNNGEGVTGTMWDADLRVYSAPTDPDGNLPYTGLADKLELAAQHGARVINGSFGAFHNEAGNFWFRYRWWKQLLSGLVDMGEDPLFVFAAGNDSQPAANHLPSALADDPDIGDRIVSVGAIQQNGGIWVSGSGGSNFGQGVTVFAPGADILTTRPGGFLVPDYIAVTGTSIAAPFITGIGGLALTKAEACGAEVTAAELKQAIVDGADARGELIVDPTGQGQPPRPVADAFETIQLVEQRFCPSGRITVRKVVDEGKHLTPPPDVDFRFELDGGKAIELGDTQTFTWQQLTPGVYEISEILSSSQLGDGWQIEFIECSPFNSVVGGSQVSISVALEAGQSIVCVFENFHETVGAPGEITVRKQTNIATAEWFEFQLDPGDSTFVGAGGEFTWNSLAAGSYLLTEILSDAQILDGWNLQSANCGGTAISPRPAGMALFLRGGENIVCTFRNDSGGSGAVIATLATGSNAGEGSGLTIGDDNLPVAVYHHGPGTQAKVVHCEDPLCVDTTITHLFTTLSWAGTNPSSIVIGGDGLPVVSIGRAGNLLAVHCEDVTCSSTTATAYERHPSDVFGTDVAIGSDGLPVISFVEHDRDALSYTAVLAHCDNPACTSATFTSLAVSDSIDSITSVAIGADGLPVVAFFDRSAAALKVAHCEDPSCSAFTVFEPGGSIQPSMTIGSDGLPVIATAIGVIHCDDLRCSSSSISYALDVGWWPSIDIGHDGMPMISYQDATARDLRLALCRDLACVEAAVVVIDADRTDGDTVGEYSSLAVRSDGIPVIAYAVGNHLAGSDSFADHYFKIAVCGNETCS